MGWEVGELYISKPLELQALPATWRIMYNCAERTASPTRRIPVRNAAQDLVLHTVGAKIITDIILRSI